MAGKRKRRRTAKYEQYMKEKEGNSTSTSGSDEDTDTDTTGKDVMSSDDTENDIEENHVPVADNTSNNGIDETNDLSCIEEVEGTLAELVDWLNCYIPRLEENEASASNVNHHGDSPSKSNINENTEHNEEEHRE